MTKSLNWPVDKIAYMTNMRNVIRDKIYEAERNYVAYYDARRSDDKTIKVGSLVRLNLDHIKLNLFKKRESKLNPLWYGPFRILAQPSPVSFTLQLPNDTRLHDSYLPRIKVKTCDRSSLFTTRIQKDIHPDGPSY